MKQVIAQPVDANGLARAIYEGNLDLVKSYVEQGSDINALDQYQMPLFSHAILSNNQKIIDFFFEKGAEVNPSHAYVQMTPLGAAVITATKAKSTEEMNYTFMKLIELGADLDPSNCATPLLNQIIFDNGPSAELIMRYLVSKGAEINPTANNIDPPLTTATRIIGTTFDNKLFWACIDLGAKANPVNPTQQSPLKAAVQMGGGIAKLMIDTLIKLGADVNFGDAPHTKAITSAAFIGDLDLAKYLVSKGAQIDLMGNSCDYLIEQSLGENRAKVVKYLMEEADKQGKAYDAKKLLNSSLSYFPNQELAYFLIEKGVETDMINPTLNLKEKWVREVATKFNHPCSEAISLVEQGDIFKATDVLLMSPYIAQRNNISHLLETIRGNGGKSLIQKLIKDYNYNTSDITKAFNLLQLKHTFKDGKFVLSTQVCGNESSSYSSAANIKQTSETYINNEKILLKATGKLLGSKPSDTNDGMIYVINKKGTLFVNAKGHVGLHHSYFLPGTEGKTKLGEVSLYGFGKPVACGGSIKLQDGLITEIDNGSGHYAPGRDQLLIVCKYFKDLGILDKNVIIKSFHGNDGGQDKFVDIDPSYLDTLDIGAILSKYPSLDSPDQAVILGEQLDLS
jgi:ankyrin repeat protein